MFKKILLNEMFDMKDNFKNTFKMTSEYMLKFLNQPDFLKKFEIHQLKNERIVFKKSKYKRPEHILTYISDEDKIKTNLSQSEVDKMFFKS